MKHAIAICFFALLSACGYNDFEEPQAEVVDLPVPSLSIATLRSLYPGHSVAVNTANMVVEGYVVTSDKAGNFHRSFIIEDETGALEIRAGLYDLHTLYPLNRRIVVKATGLTLGMSDGVLQLGLPSESYPTAYMDHPTLIDRYVFRDDTYEKIPARPAEIAALREEWCGTLVRLENLYSAETPDTTWAIPARLSATGVPRSADIKLRSDPTDSIYVSTSGYANFAGESVPRGTFALQGILMRGMVGGREVYQLKLRDFDDLQR